MDDDLWNRLEVAVLIAALVLLSGAFAVGFVLGRWTC